MNNNPRLSTEEDRRLFRKCTKRDSRAFINYDKLYINGFEYRPQSDGPMMRFLQPGNPEPHMRFPPPRNPDNHYQYVRQARGATGENAPRSKKQKLNFSEIKYICLNVCGIKSKLVLPEFI